MAGDRTRERAEGEKSESKWEVLNFIAIIWTIVVTVSKMGTYLKILSRKVPWYDSNLRGSL